MFNATEIALWFIYKSNAEQKEHYDSEELFEGISDLKLQKLLYYAQGVCLSMTGKKMFSNKIYAWDHGPVVKEVYDVYKKYGSSYITDINDEKNDKIVNNIENNVEISKILNIVYDNFAIYTAWQLRNMTHQVGSPWYNTVRNREIDTKTIKKYFDEVVMEN